MNLTGQLDLTDMLDLTGQLNLSGHLDLTGQTTGLHSYRSGTTKLLVLFLSTVMLFDVIINR